MTDMALSLTLTYFIFMFGLFAATPSSRIPGENVEVRIAEVIFNESQMTSYTSLPLCRVEKGAVDPNITFKLHDKPAKQVRMLKTMYDIKMGNTEFCKVLLCGAGEQKNESYLFTWTAKQGRTVAALIREDFQITMTVDDVLCTNAVPDLEGKWKNGYPLGADIRLRDLPFNDTTNPDIRWYPSDNTRQYLYNHLSFTIEYELLDYFDPDNAKFDPPREVTECEVRAQSRPLYYYTFHNNDVQCYIDVGLPEPLLVHENDVTKTIFTYDVKWKRKPKTYEQMRWFQEQPSIALADRNPKNTGESNLKAEHEAPKSDDSSLRKSIAIAVAVIFAAIGISCSTYFTVVWMKRRRIAKNIRPHTKIVSNDADIPLESCLSQDEATFGYSCAYECTHSEIIGKGRYGTVYKATIKIGSEMSVEKCGAVKVTHCTDGESMILTEAENWRLQHLVLLRHEHLVAYHKITITRRPTGATVELLMDYCNGGDLAGLLKKLRGNDDLLSEILAMRYAKEIARGLEFLHRNKILHGDLKPENILVQQSGTDEERLLIGDLDDLVQMWRTTTCSQDVKHLRGTIRYMSPEMLKKFAIDPTESVGRKTDIWSLGCIMLDLANHVTGSHEKWLVSLQDRILVEDTMPQHRFATLILDGYSHLVSDNPARFSALTRQCLRVPRKDRLSAEELLDQLSTAATELNS